MYCGQLQFPNKRCIRHTHSVLPHIWGRRNHAVALVLLTVMCACIAYTSYVVGDLGTNTLRCNSLAGAPYLKPNLKVGSGDVLDSPDVAVPSGSGCVTFLRLFRGLLRYLFDNMCLFIARCRCVCWRGKRNHTLSVLPLSCCPVLFDAFDERDSQSVNTVTPIVQFLTWGQCN